MLRVAKWQMLNYDEAPDCNDLVRFIITLACEIIAKQIKVLMFFVC